MLPSIKKVNFLVSDKRYTTVRKGKNTLKYLESERLTDDVTSSKHINNKKSEPLSLPPAKQNGQLVTSGDEYPSQKRDRNNNENSHIKRDEKRHQPNATKKSQDADTGDIRKQKAEKDQRNSKKMTTSEAKTRSDNPSNFSSKDEKSSTYSKASNQTSQSNKQSTVTDKQSQPPTKQPHKDADRVKSEKNEKKILDLTKEVKSPRSKTPNTVRSATPRAKTPRSKTPSYLIKPHKVRYGVSKPKTHKADQKLDTSRTPEPKKSILNNRDAVKMERSSTSNSRPSTYKWEKEKSIYRNQLKDWDIDPDELTYRPNLNSPTDWLRVYVGDINLRDALRTAKSREDLDQEPGNRKKRKPGYPYRYEKEYILSRVQVQPYKNMKSVYGDKTYKQKKYRQTKFYEKLQDFQIMKAKLKIEEMREREKKKEETKKRQQKQLKELRQRFEDAAWVRFNSQYVTSRVLEHEKMNRYEYGLPEEIDGEAEFAAKLKRKPVKTTIDLDKLEKKNKEVYGSIFNIHRGPNFERNLKTPPMEGIDTVTLEYVDEHGTKVEKTRRVKDVINGARREMENLKVKKNNTNLTPREEKVIDNKTYATHLSDNESDDDDDDMSDIFERARKKYNLEVDDDEDSKSRR